MQNVRRLSTFAMLLLLAPPASGVMTPHSDGREIACFYSDPHFSTSQDESPPTPFAAWSDAVSCASAYSGDQASEAVTPTRMAASGSTYGFSETGDARSTFLVSFSLSSSEEVFLTGSLSKDDLALSSAEIELRGESGVLYSKSATGPAPTPVSYHAVLAPGVYELFAEAAWFDPVEFAADDADFDFVFQLAVDPPAPADGGPPALYAPEPALPAPPGWPFGEHFPRTSGAGRVAAGAYFWSDFLYDDQGATGTGTPENESPGAPSFGTYRYPDPEAGANGADLFRVAIGADATDTWWRVDWNTLIDPDYPIAAFAIDSDGDAGTGVASWPANAALVSPGIDHVLVLSAAGAWLHDLTAFPVPTVTDVSGAGGAVSLDVAARSFVVRLPRALHDPTPGVSTVYVAAGIADAEGDGFLQLDASYGAAPGQPNVFNMAFRDYADEPPSAWFDDSQAANLAAGDASAFSAALDWSRLLAGDVDPEPLVTGYVNRWYVSSIEPGQGITTQNALGPHYLNRVQPYMAFIPSSYDPATPAPLTFWLHGASANHNSQASQNPNTLQGMCEQRGSICVSTLGRGPLGQYENEAELDYWEVWRSLASRLSLDPDRTIQSGYSMGGFGSYRFVQNYPDLYAAVVIMAATDVGPPDPSADGARLENMKWTPYYHNHGGADQLVPVSGAVATVQALDDLEYRYRFDLYPAADHVAYSISDHFEDAIQFMTEQGGRTVDPGHVIYRWLLADVDAQGRFGPTGAWWVDELVARDAGLPDARVEARSLRKPDPALVEVVRTMETRPEAQPSPAERQELAWVLGPPPPAEDRLTLDLDNVGSATIDLLRSGLAGGPGGQRSIEVDTDGPSDVVIDRLWHGTAAFLDDAPAGAAGPDHRLTVPVPAGQHVISMPAPGRGGLVAGLVLVAGLWARRWWSRERRG